MPSTLPSTFARVVQHEALRPQNLGQGWLSSGAVSNEVPNKVTELSSVPWFLWISMDYYGFLWITMDLYGFLRFPFPSTKNVGYRIFTGKIHDQKSHPSASRFCNVCSLTHRLDDQQNTKGVFGPQRSRETKHNSNDICQFSRTIVKFLEYFWVSKHPTRTLWEQTVASDSQADKQPPVTKRELPIVSWVWDTDMDPHPNLRLIADKFRWIMTPNAPAYCKYTVSLEPFWTTIACLEDIMSRESTSRHSPNDHSDICKPQNSKHSHETTCHGPLRPGPSTVSWKHHDSITSVDSPPSS